MDFSDMQDWVIRTTKRPDKREDIKDAINGAISFFTLGASFADDLVEGSVAIDSTEYAQSFSIASTFTRFRRLVYLKRPAAKAYIDPTTPQQVFDKNGCEKLDRYYRAGDNIIFKLRSLSATLLYGYLQYPARLSADADTHWMFDKMPDAIHRKACAQIFDDIGEPQDSARFDKKANELFLVAKEDFEYGVTEVAR